MPERKLKYPLILWGLVMFHLANTYLWLKLNQSYLCTYDAHRYFFGSLKIFEAYKAFPHQLSALLYAFPYQVPLVGWVTAPFYFFLGTVPAAGVMVNALIFLPLLVFSVYGIGKRMADERSGLFAAFLVSAYPVVFNQLKVYMLDLPLTAVVTLSLYLLIRSRGFSDRRYSLFFGIACGAGMLVKQYYFFFMLGPLAYTVIGDIVRGLPDGRRQRLFNAFLGMAVAALICMPYYIVNFPLLFYKNSIRWTTTWPTSVPAAGLPVYLARSLLWYLWGFINWQVTFFYSLLFIAGLFVFRRISCGYKGLVYVWALSSWLFISYARCSIGFNMEVTGIRYTMPLLPAVALITAIGILRIPGRVRNAVVAAAVLFGIAQVFFISYPILGRSRGRISVPVRVPQAIERHRFFPESLSILNLGAWSVSGSAFGSYPSDGTEYDRAYGEILSIFRSSQDPARRVTVFVIPDNTELWSLQYKAYISHRSLRIICDWNLIGTEINMKNLYDGDVIETLIHDADYVVDKPDGFNGEAYIQPFVEKAQLCLDQHRDEFLPPENVRWPDGSFISVLRKK